jgi:CBS domain-containing protein
MTKERNVILPNKEIPHPEGTVADMLEVKGSIVYSIAPDATVYEAVERMDQRHVGALVVMTGPKLVGIVSERDYTSKIILLGRASKETRVDEIMTTKVQTVTPTTTLGECLRVVTEWKARHLPVIKDGKVVGMVSIGDLVRAVVEQQAETIRNLSTFINADYPQ